MVMFGTKWPSITSTWIQSAPAVSKLGDVFTQAQVIRGDDGGGDDVVGAGHFDLRLSIGNLRTGMSGSMVDSSGPPCLTI